MAGAWSRPRIALPTNSAPPICGHSQRAKKPVKPRASQVLSALSATPPLTRRFTKQHSVMPLARARDGSISAAMSHVTGPMPTLKLTCAEGRRT